METTIALAKTMEANMPIPRIEGKIKQLWERKTGSNTNGDWSMQSGILTDSTGEMKFTLSGCPPMEFENGDKVIFKCASGKKGLTGVKVKINTYGGKNEPCIWVTPSSLILSDEGVQNSPHEPAVTNVTEAIDKTFKPNTKQTNWRDRHNMTANLYAECYTTASEMGFARGIPKENWKDVASCLFIQGIKDQMQYSMPTDLIWKTKIKPQTEGNPDIAQDDIPF